MNEMQHYLTLNKDHVVPHFSIGWSDLLNHYNIVQVKEIWFLYCGGGSFFISIGNVLNSTDEYPAFIRSSTKPNETTYFDVVLSEYTAISSQLTLHKDFGDYLRATDLKFVMLCNETIKCVQSSVLCRGPRKPSVKLGRGWKEFCKISGYKNGDTIRFKFDGTLSSNLIHVRQIDPY
ncbi:unnamed protein product [Trifolium pratense]|uniref:Uncharacterized protein n=1 Tax=Trifolium pratense TaxID=57577 RepID=A0ACB0ISP0_TRIPR|nr:unnamed protein product [Trifolium pratense]